MSADDTPALLASAANGDQSAWNRIVAQYERLVWSVARGYRLGEASTDDVVQTVWLRLAEHCTRIRRPERLAGWLATTTRNEALRVMRSQQRVTPIDDIGEHLPATPGTLDDGLIADEEMHDVVEAFRALDDDTRTFLQWFCTDPPLDYETISELSGRPIGSLGPTRARCLDKLRRELARRSDRGADA